MASERQDAPEGELLMLAGIAGFFHWIEELLNILNGPVLMVGAGIALVDLLTDGRLTATAPALLLTWAVSQALGIEAQLLGSFTRVRSARGWRLFGWLVLGGMLGFATWQAGYVFAIQQSQHLSEAAALSQLHMSPQVWLGWRAFLAVGLVALAGLTRYRKPAKVTASLADERATLERELTLEPLRQRLRAQQVGGFRALAETALRGASEPPAVTMTPPAPATPALPSSTRAVHHPGDDANMAGDDLNDQRATQPQMRAVIGGQSFDLDWGDEYDPDNPDDDDDPDDSRANGRRGRSDGTKASRNGHKSGMYQAPRNGTNGHRAEQRDNESGGDEDSRAQADRKRRRKLALQERQAKLNELRQERVYQELCALLDDNPNLTPHALRTRLDDLKLGTMRYHTAQRMIEDELTRRGLTRYPSSSTTAEYDGDEGDDREAFDLDDLAETREMRAIQA